MSAPEAVRGGLEEADWCQQCREAGMAHCADPDRCGGMKRVPFPQAEAAYKALTEEPHDGR